MTFTPRESLRIVLLHSADQLFQVVLLFPAIVYYEHWHGFLVEERNGLLVYGTYLAWPVSRRSRKQLPALTHEQEVVWCCRTADRFQVRRLSLTLE